uniref:NADH-ubiquinone oxidoreductase chain 4L n=1 Tax=Nymphon unguiculatum-charcoti complex sp. SEM-1997 TaxID=61899 RepID=E0XLH5_9CHEL|nr:NADH dehydrogenase subunit 4L [Nymphon unguiculatum-charcoti complex sp. SEM-1997]
MHKHMMMFLIYLSFLFSCYIFLSVRSNLLIMIISLELMVLITYWNMTLILSMNSMDYFLSLYFLSVTVCDSAIALTLLVRIVRLHGNDKIKMISSIF